MGLTYLIDTNTLSETEKIDAHPNVVRQLQLHRQQLALASITWHEILYGYYRLPPSKRKERVGYFIEHTLAHIPILPYDETAAEWFARERARLTQSGRTPPYADGQIAAIAATNNLVLVTRNTTDFAHFEQLRLIDWFK